ncbi:MAG: HK97 family phage prohead protease [Saprospiraceae bacterium]|nr:HK97 family phage prohead protease [Saprospiraceae bacterium]
MIIRAFNVDNFEVRATDKDREREFIISTERKDSHGTIIKMDGWQIDDFNRNGAFYYQHQTSGGFLTEANPDNALGTAKAFKDGNNLLGRANFEPKEINELAEKILKKVDFGTMRGTSVGFIPESGNWGNEKEGQDPETYYFTSQRLVEFSIVHIPSNPDAVKKSLESLDTFLLSVKDNHKSEGFKKDLERKMRNTKFYRDYLYNLMERRNF